MEEIKKIKVANGIVAYMEFDKPVKQSVLSSLLGVGERDIRKAIKYINDRFNDGIVDYIIIGTNDGNVITRDEVKIREYNKSKRNHALSELKSSYNANKQLTKRNNLTFSDYLAELDKELSIVMDND